MNKKSKTLIERHKEKVHTALSDLEYTVNNCSKETPRTVARAMDALRNAVNDNVLYAEEENSYKKVISDHIKQFEKNCICNKK